MRKTSIPSRQDDITSAWLLVVKTLPDGRELHVWPLIYQRARLGITCLRASPQAGYRDVW